ncbi:MAG: DUF4405 domain-containing protein [Bacillota bacterium]|nr:DUF4405 domain-containing protein [Bacillota bacterium]
MKKINYIKIILDILMALVFVLLFNKNAISGISFHEIAGLTLGMAFIIHILINFKWVKKITIKFFNSKIKLKTRIGYIVDLLLLIDMALIIGTGISISKVLFSGIFKSAGNQSLHISLSYIALMLIGIHVGLHWDWVMNVFKNTFKISKKGMTCKIINSVLVVSLFAFGSYNIYSNSYFTKIIPGSSISQQEPGMGKMPSDGNFNPGNNNGNPPNGNSNNNNSANVNANTNNNSANGNTNNAANNNGSVNTNDNSRPVPPNGGNFNGNGAGGMGRGGMKASGSSNILSTILSNLSIISFFSIITFYIEKLLKLKARKQA